jgi:hypothetical protein
MKRATIVLTACLLMCVVSRSQQVTPVATTDIKGFYIGMPFDDWTHSPVFGRASGRAAMESVQPRPSCVSSFCATR